MRQVDHHFALHARESFRIRASAVAKLSLRARAPLRGPCASPRSHPGRPRCTVFVLTPRTTARSFVGGRRSPEARAGLGSRPARARKYAGGGRGVIVPDWTSLERQAEGADSSLYRSRRPDQDALGDPDRERGRSRVVRRARLTLAASRSVEALFAAHGRTVSLAQARARPPEFGPGVAPTPMSGDMPHDEYAKAEWSYGDALALVGQLGDTVIVEMESVGIGRIAKALKLDERVVVLRVTTDSLTDHGDSDNERRDLLERGRVALGLVLLVLLVPTRFAQ